MAASAQCADGKVCYGTVAAERLRELIGRRRVGVRALSGEGGGRRKHVPIEVTEFYLGHVAKE